MAPSTKRTGTGAAASGRGHSSAVARTSRPSVAAPVNDLTVNWEVCAPTGCVPALCHRRLRSLFQTPERLKASAPSLASGSPSRNPKIQLFVRIKPARNKRTTAPITALIREPRRPPCGHTQRADKSAHHTHDNVPENANPATLHHLASEPSCGAAPQDAIRSGDKLSFVRSYYPPRDDRQSRPARHRRAAPPRTARAEQVPSRRR
jgi:hypothetical protein